MLSFALRAAIRNRSFTPWFDCECGGSDDDDDDDDFGCWRFNSNEAMLHTHIFSSFNLIYAISNLKRSSR